MICGGKGRCRMPKQYVPAVFCEEDSGYSVRFPDLDGCFTEGDTLDEAYEMAFDAIGLYVEQPDGGFALPECSNPNQFALSDNEFIALIEFDSLEYLKKHGNRAVKKTLTIPSWLNYQAEKAKAPFSQILQEGLKDYLQSKEVI